MGQNDAVLSGRIIDERAQGVYSLVNLKDSIKTQSTYTDFDGNFSFKLLHSGTYTIYIEASIDHEAVSQKVMLKKGEHKTIDIITPTHTNTIAPMEIFGDKKKTVKNLEGTGTIISEEKLTETNPIGVQEALEKLTPGITSAADDGIGNARINIGIRGLNPRRSSRVLLLEDGIPIQPAIYLYPNAYYNPPVERISSIEVIKGSGSLLYGPQTMGGVINYITKRPGNTTGGEAILTGGSYGYFSSYIDVNGWGEGKSNPGIQLLYKRSDGWRDNNSFDQFNGTFKLNTKFNKRKNLYIKFNVDKEFYNATYTGLTEYSFKTNPNFNPKEHDTFDLFRTSLDGIYTTKVNDHVTGNTKAYFFYFDRKWWRENDVFYTASSYGNDGATPVSWSTPGNLVRAGDGETNFGILRTFYTAGIEHDYTIKHNISKTKADLKVGARYHWERFIDDRKSGFSPTERDGFYYLTKGVDKEWNTWNAQNPSSNTDSIAIIGQSHHYETTAFSFFAEETIHLTEKFKVTGGLRTELFEQTRIDRLDGSKLQDATTFVLLPGIGFNWELGSKDEIGNTNIFGGIHRGYTPPSSGVIRVVNFGQDLESGGIDLKAEKSWNTELGIRNNSKLLSLEVAAFHLSVEDMVAAARGTVFENLGRVRTYGIETLIQLKLDSVAPFLPELYINYTYLQTEIVEASIKSNVIGQQGQVVSLAGNELAYAPRHTATVGLYKAFKNGFSAYVDVRYLSKSYTDLENIEYTENRGDTGPIQAYAILNGGINYRMNERWRFFFSGKNLTDLAYIGSRLHSNPGQKEAGASSGIIIGPRRQLLFGINYKF